MQLTAIIHTKNSSSTVEAALKSVAFADSTLVVDMHSTDDTLELVKKYTKNTFEFDDVGYVEPARNFALSKVTTDWVLLVDADEVVTPSLIEDIQKIIEAAQADAYFIPRRNLIFGKSIENSGWWPDYQLRLFKKGMVEWSDKIHSVPTLRGSSAYLPQSFEACLVHTNYTSLTQYVERMNNYTSIQAKESGPLSNNAVTTVLAQFRAELLTRLFAIQGIDEGIHGLGLSYLQAFSEVVLAMKRWELAGSKPTQADQQQIVFELRQFQRELNYWIADWEVSHCSPLRALIARFKRKCKL